MNSQIILKLSTVGFRIKPSSFTEKQKELLRYLSIITKEKSEIDSISFYRKELNFLIIFELKGNIVTYHRIYDKSHLSTILSYIVLRKIPLYSTEEKDSKNDLIFSPKLYLPSQIMSFNLLTIYMIMCGISNIRIYDRKIVESLTYKGDKVGKSVTFYYQNNDHWYKLINDMGYEDIFKTTREKIFSIIREIAIRKIPIYDESGNMIISNICYNIYEDLCL